MPERLLTDAQVFMAPLYWKKETENHLRLFPYPERRRLPQIHSSLVITDYRPESIAAVTKLPLDEAITTICSPACVTVRLFEGSCEGIICGVELREPLRENNPEQLFSITGWQAPFHRKKTSYKEQPFWSYELISIAGCLRKKMFIVLLNLTDQWRKTHVFQGKKEVEIGDTIRISTIREPP